MIIPNKTLMFLRSRIWGKFLHVPRYFNRDVKFIEIKCDSDTGYKGISKKLLWKAQVYLNEGFIKYAVQKKENTLGSLRVK